MERCYANATSRVGIYSEIVAEEHTVEELEFDVAPFQGSPEKYDRYYRSIGGTVLLKEAAGNVQTPRATQSFLSYNSCPGGRTSLYSPLIVVGNGGPSTPATRHNALVFAGPLMVAHDRLRYGRWRESDYGHPIEKLAYNPDSLVNLGGPVLCVDPVETGVGTMLDGQDPTWYRGMQRDINTTAATIEWFRETHKHQDRPLMLVATSYGAMRMTGIALELASKGITVDAMVFLGGAYDNNTSFIKKSQSDLPYISGLPAMAATRRFFEGTPSTGSEDVFSNARDFALAHYAPALQKDQEVGLSYSEESFILSHLSKITGLSRDLLKENNLRIDSTTFVQNCIPHHRLSVIDSRLKYPLNHEFTIDPLLDETARIHRNLVERYGTAIGYSDTLLNNYQDTQHLYYKGWDFTGWEDENIYGAMKQVMKAHPKIVIVDIAGYFDLNTSAPRSKMFWDRLHKDKSMAFSLRSPSLRHRPDLQPSDYMPSVRSFTLPIGHQMNYDGYQRTIISQIMRSTARHLAAQKRRK